MELNVETIEKLQSTKKDVVFREIKDGDKVIARLSEVPVEHGFELQSVEKFIEEMREKPKRRKGTLTAYDLESFVALTNGFKSENSVMFGTTSVTETSFTAALKSVLNFDPASPNNTEADNGDHVVGYAFPLSNELKVWLGKNKTPFNAKEFAEFLEDNIADLIIPKVDGFKTQFGDERPAFASPSKIFELSRGIEVRVDEKVSNYFRNADGSFNLQYTQENKDAAGNALKLPEWFCLGVPVFDGGEVYQIPMRLKFRVKEGQVAWSFDMYRKNDTFNAAFADACDQATKETDLPLFNGSPAR